MESYHLLWSQIICWINFSGCIQLARAINSIELQVWNLTPCMPLKEQKFTIFDNDFFDVLQGKVPLMSVEAIHELHIFIFVLAATHVMFSLITVVLGIMQVMAWQHLFLTKMLVQHAKKFEIFKYFRCANGEAGKIQFRKRRGTVRIKLGNLDMIVSITVLSLAPYPHCIGFAFSNNVSTYILTRSMRWIDWDVFAE